MNFGKKIFIKVLQGMKFDFQWIFPVNNCFKVEKIGSYHKALIACYFQCDAQSTKYLYLSIQIVNSVYFLKIFVNF